MRAGDVEPDSFYYDRAIELLARERGTAPFFVPLHGRQPLPVGLACLPEPTPGWRAPGNRPVVDEYVRRQLRRAGL